MLCTVAVWGAAFAGFAVAPRLWLALSLLAVAGAADASAMLHMTKIGRASRARINVPENIIMRSVDDPP